MECVCCPGSLVIHSGRPLFPSPSEQLDWTNKMAIKRNKYLNCLNLIVSYTSHHGHSSLPPSSVQSTLFHWTKCDSIKLISNDDLRFPERPGGSRLVNFLPLSVQLTLILFFGLWSLTGIRSRLQCSLAPSLTPQGGGEHTRTGETHEIDLN